MVSVTPPIVCGGFNELGDIDIPAARFVPKMVMMLPGAM